MVSSALRCMRFVMRRRATVLGAACTGAFVGLIVLDKFVLNGSACLSSCSTARPLSYTVLQRNEATRKFHRHPRVKAFESNFLHSNSPMEDRFVVGVSPGTTSALFSVIDGHKGYQCSSYLQKHLLDRVVSKLHTCAELPGGSDLSVLMDMDSYQKDLESSTQKIEHAGQTLSLSSKAMASCLQDAFQSLDKDISSQALNDIEMVHKGHSFTADMKRRVMTAIDGACAIMALVQESDVYVANTGDCRVVLGHELPNHSWKAIPLSTDQNADNAAEVERLQEAHPGEESTVIMNKRVLGNLMPFRTFGDCDYKWERDVLEGIVYVSPFYRSPPYIIAEPVVSHHKIDKGDQFLIIASDGLWERISNEEAVNVVVETLRNKSKEPSLLSSLFSSAKGDCCVENAATNLLWYALGGEEEKVSRLLNVSPEWSRMMRDDITIVVVHFHS